MESPDAFLARIGTVTRSSRRKEALTEVSLLTSAATRFTESLRGTSSIALRFCQRPVACSLCAMRLGRGRDGTVEQGGQNPASGIGPESVLEADDVEIARKADPVNGQRDQRHCLKSIH